MEAVRGICGMAALVMVGILLSKNRRSIKLRPVVSALVMQVAIGGLVLFVPEGAAMLDKTASGVSAFLDAGNRGVSFLFGGLVSDKMTHVFGGDGFVFAIRVLPMIFFVTALISVMYHLGIMEWIVRILGFIFQKTIGVTKVEACIAVATIFLGHTDIPAVVKPFVRTMTRAELFCVMSSGMASISGSVLAGYAGLGVKMEYLLAASFMAVPGGLLFAKLLYPTTQAPQDDFTHLNFDERRASNFIDAAAAGAAIGLKIAANVGAMLVAFIGLIALVNGALGWISGLFGSHLTLQQILGYLFAPVAWLIGIQWHEATLSGNFIGEKLILNEFVAYADLAPYLRSPAEVAAAGLRVLDPRSLAIISFALCGFANFASIAILAGGFTVVAPERRSEVSRYGLRVVAAGMLSNLMSAAIAGIFLSLR